MSEPIPESIPTSHDPRSKRPTKRLALTSTSQQASQVSALFAKPDREIAIPTSEPSAKRGLAPPPEIVANVQGSSAGAGSGEFHVYKASRRREYERLRLMDEEVKHEKETEEFEKTKEERKKKDEAKTNKNKARREKQKAKKGGKGKSKASEDGSTNGAAAKQIVNGTVMSVGDGADDINVTPEVKVLPEEGVVIHDDD